PAYELSTGLEFRRGLFRSGGRPGAARGGRTGAHPGSFRGPRRGGGGGVGEGARWTAGAGPGCRRDAGRQRGGGTPVRTGVPSGTASTAESDGGVNGPVGADQLSTVALPVGSEPNVAWTNDVVNPSRHNGVWRAGALAGRGATATGSIPMPPVA